MWKTFVKALVLALLPAMAGAAVERDRQAMAEDPRVFAALEEAVGSDTVSEAIAHRIGPLMYEDNQLTRDESDLFLELLDSMGGTIAISSPAGEVIQVPALSGGARYFLALSDPPDIDGLWLSGRFEMKQMIDITVLNPNVRIQVQHFIANQLYLRWRTSNAFNNHKPLRDTLSIAYRQWRSAGPETEVLAKALIYDAMLELDLALKGAVPDSIYDHLKS